MVINLDAVVHFLWEQCDTAPYNVFAVGTTLVFCYTLRPTYDTKKYFVQGEWNVTKSSHQYHT